jgi:hypothetical protein
MIPKTIHYCWLSGDPIPAKLRRCMDSWSERLPGFEFMLWNFDRFDIESSIWVKQAFEAKKYASAADYIRLFAVYTHGGIYLDMDVEVIKPFDEAMLQAPLMLARENDETKLIEAGCFGAEKEHFYIKKCLDYYTDRQFSAEDAEGYIYTLPKVMTAVLHGYAGGHSMGAIYPQDYFTAKNGKTGIVHTTKNTYCIHHFAGSWLPPARQFYERIRNKSIKLFGITPGRLLVLPLFVIMLLKVSGINGFKSRVKTALAKTSSGRRVRKN